jgi:hypothetical protein
MWSVVISASSPSPQPSKPNNKVEGAVLPVFSKPKGFRFGEATMIWYSRLLAATASQLSFDGQQCCEPTFHSFKLGDNS